LGTRSLEATFSAAAESGCHSGTGNCFLLVDPNSGQPKSPSRYGD
jgi:hypothetical protein